LPGLNAEFTFKKPWRRWWRGYKDTTPLEWVVFSVPGNKRVTDLAHHSYNFCLFKNVEMMAAALCTESVGAPLAGALRCPGITFHVTDIDGA